MISIAYLLEQNTSYNSFYVFFHIVLFKYFFAFLPIIVVFPFPPSSIPLMQLLHKQF